MFDVGWSEMLVVGALALIVVGPRELPQLLRSVGRWVGQIKRMAREFQRSMEDAARDTDLASMKELRDLKKDMGSLDFRQQAAKAQSYLKQPAKIESARSASKPAALAEASAPEAAPTPPAPAAEPAPPAAATPADRPSPGVVPPGDPPGAKVSEG